jgi:purine-binding chemotaxis protein CheW
METIETSLTDERLEEILRERARLLSEAPDAEEDRGKTSAIVFQLGEEFFGVELNQLLETRQPTPLRRIPCAPSYLAGLVNLRGEILPVIDLRPHLGLPAGESGDASSLLVLLHKDKKLALAVDRVKEILNIAPLDLKTPPLSLDASQAIFTRGEVVAENHIVTVLDIERILSGVITSEKEPR